MDSLAISNAQAPVINALLTALALPTVGLSAVFVAAFVSATLLPIGSEPAVFALVKFNSELFWPAILVATAGNTLGGVITYAMGYGAKRALAKEHDTRYLNWVQRVGPKALLLAWLPVVGDPFCALAGWLKMPLLPCLGYMAVGKFARYLTVTSLLMFVPDGIWLSIGRLM